MLYFITYVNSCSRKLLCVGSVLGLLGLFRYSPGLIMKCVCMEGALMAEMAAMNTPLCPLGNFKAPFVSTKQRCGVKVSPGIFFRLCQRLVYAQRYLGKKPNNFCSFKAFFFKSLYLLQYCFCFVGVFWPGGIWDLGCPLGMEPTPPVLEGRVFF